MTAFVVEFINGPHDGLVMQIPPPGFPPQILTDGGIANEAEMYSPPFGDYDMSLPPVIMERWVAVYEPMFDPTGHVSRNDLGYAKYRFKEMYKQ